MVVCRWWHGANEGVLFMTRRVSRETFCSAGCAVLLSETEFSSSISIVPLQGGLNPLERWDVFRGFAILFIRALSLYSHSVTLHFPQIEPKTKIVLPTSTAK